VTASLGDAPVDRDMRKVFHSGGHDDSLDSTSQFHLPLSVRSPRPGHSAAVCQLLASSLTPLRSKPAKCPVERRHYESSKGMRHKNQRYFFVPSKPKHLHNSMPIHDLNPLQTKTKIKNSIERLSFPITLPPRLRDSNDERQPQAKNSGETTLVQWTEKLRLPAKPS
jgi:hypothetical protein